MKKIILTSLTFLASIFFVRAQFFNEYWVIPPYSLEFNTMGDKTLKDLPFYLLPHDELIRGNGSGLIAPNGNVLFYTNNYNTYDVAGLPTDNFRYVWNNYKFENNSLSYHGIESLQDRKPSGEMVIVPAPKSCNRYYIFWMSIVAGSETGQSNRSCFYSVYDTDSLHYDAVYNYTGKFVYDMPNMSPASSNAMRDLIPTSYAANLHYPYDDILNLSNLSGYKSSSVHIAVSKPRPDGSYRIFVADEDYVYRFKLDENGLFFDNYHFGFGGALGAGSMVNKSQYLSEMELYEFPDGRKLIALKYFDVASGRGNMIHISELNSSDNVIGERGIIIGGGTNNRIRGLEFSENGNYLYFTQEKTNNANSDRTLGYINLVNNSVHTLSTNYLYQLSMIELAPDGMIYGKSLNNLFRVTDPNNPTTTSVELFNPINMTSSSSINYGSFPYQDGTNDFYNKLPDQIDGMSYMDHFFATLQCCIKYESYDKETFKSTSSTTWTGNNNPLNNSSGNDVYIRDELVIKAGHTVTISNMKIHFAPGAKLVIEKGTASQKGGHLILRNGTVLTADTKCSANSMWQGVIVEGNPSIPQGVSFSASNQAKIEMIEGATIEHAIVGVFLGVPSITHNHIPSSTNPAGGGIIITNNARFRNNMESVRFNDYSNVYLGQVRMNLSNFILTTFETTSALNIPTIYPNAHLIMNSVRGIDIKGCTFDNSYGRANNQLYTRWGRGIASFNSFFRVEPYCANLSSINCDGNNGTRNVFSNLNKGINATASDPYMNFYCDFSHFENNASGIEASGILNAHITNNGFKILNSVEAIFLGVGLDNCSKYDVEGNKFEENTDNGAPYLKAIGVLIRNSNNSSLTANHNNVIYRNYFTNLFVGIQAEGINGSNIINAQAPLDGLEIKCNTFEDDIAIDVSLPSGRIKYLQGVCNASLPYTQSTQLLAGNTFLHSVYTTQDYFKKGIYFNSFFDYAYHDDSSIPNPYRIYNIYPSLFTETSCSTVSFDNNLSCPVKSLKLVSQNNGSAGSSHLSVGNLSNLNSLLKDYFMQYTAMNDPDIFQFMSLNSIDNITVFLKEYEILSDSVLKYYIDLGPAYNLYISVLETQEGLSSYMGDYITNKILNEGLEGDIDEINNYIENKGRFEEFIEGWSLLRTKRDFLLKDMYILYQNEDIQAAVGIAFPLDSLFGFAQQIDKADEKYLVAKILSDLGEDAAANDLIDKIIELDADKYNNLAEITRLSKNYNNSFGLMEKYVRGDSSIFAKVSFLINDSLRDGLSSVGALAMYKMAYHDDVIPFWIEPLILDGAKIAPKNSENSVEKSPSGVLIYPNPTQDILNVAVRDKDGDSFDRIEIVNMLGQSVVIEKTALTKQHTLNVEGLSTGSYIIRVFSNSLPIHQQVIIKK